jgi:uncharacterized protein YcaQ
MTPTIALLRRYAVARSLFAPLSLGAAVSRLGFVQADPIRAPARAQDLTLRHRVAGYRAGDLERQYAALDVDEEFFVNYGFVPRGVRRLMHPRRRVGAWPRPGKKAAEAVLAFVRDRGRVHPREVDAQFAHGSVTNYWGGSSSATTHLLDHLHYRGLLRVACRERGIRLYAAQSVAAPVASPAERRARVDALLDVLIGLYAPLPSPTLSWLVNRLKLAVPQWRSELKSASARVRARAGSSRVGAVDWFWPASEPLAPVEVEDHARLLAPFDPVVWDRRRFSLLWEWAYRFEAYTPAQKRKLGYYALPLLWRDRVIGWGNLSVRDSELQVDLGYVTGCAPRDAAYARALDREVASMRAFLGLGDR